ncbi:MAG TPA: hypothetical protein VGW31_13500 [Hanamia sp.]|nr:hypothetical protein [Hanamia sp.]
MKTYLYVIFLSATMLFACSGSRNSVANTAEDKALIGAIKSLDKNPSDVSTQNNLNELYTEASKIHLDNIEVYETLKEADKWDKIIKEYYSLQKLSDVINSSSAAKKIIKAPSYNAQIEVARQNAAADYYQAGLSYLDNNDKRSSRQALAAFKKSNSYVAGYKDVERQLDIAFEHSVLNVVVNPVTDNSFYYSNIGRNRFGNSFNNDYLQRSLVRDLGGDFNKNSLARFYTDRDASRANIDVDWVVDLTWIDLDIPQPYTRRDSRTVSRQIEIGKDTSGRPVYKTVSAKVNVTRQYFTARGQLEYRITDMDTRNNISLNRYSSQVDWEQEYATYTGDSRALDSRYLAMIQNTNRRRLPDKDEILNELYEKIYPQVKNHIYNEVR